MLTPTSDENAIALLKADHETVQEMFDRVKAAPRRDHSATFKKIKLELDAHAHIEETIFYPRLLRSGESDLKKIVREGIEEHGQVKTMLASLARLKGTSPTFKARLQVLIENVEHHVKEEENEMFPLVERQFEREQLEALGALMKKEKAAFKARRAERSRSSTAAAKKRSASAKA